MNGSKKNIENQEEKEEKVIKRQKIDEKIFSEIREKYPTRDKDRILEKDKVQYMNQEFWVFDDENVIMQCSYSPLTIPILDFIKYKIARCGWCYKWNEMFKNGIYRDIKMRFGEFATDEVIDNTIEFWVEMKELFIVNNPNNKNIEYIISSQVLFNWETYMKSKDGGVKRINKMREEQKKREQQNKTEPVFDEEGNNIDVPSELTSTSN